MTVRRQVLGILLLPTLALAFAFADPLFQSVRVSPTCSVLPNGRVIDLGAACPLRTHDMLVGLRKANGTMVDFDRARLRQLLAEDPRDVDVEIRRGFEPTLGTLPLVRVPRAERALRAALALAVCCLLLAIPLGALRGRETDAVVPLALLNATLATVLVAFIALPNLWLYRLAIAACALLPAATAHLGFVFPLPRRRVLENPTAVGAPYFAPLLMVLPLYVSFERDALYWPEAVWMVCFFGISAWLLIVVACALAMRESDSPLERARARLLCWGALFLPALPTAWLLPAGATPTDVAMIYWISATTVLTFPIALAISRYNLFSLGDDLRQGVTAVLRVALSAAVVGTLGVAALAASGLSLSAERPLPLLVGTVAAVAVLEPSRRGVARVLEGYLRPSAERLGSVQARFSEALAELHDSIEVASLLARSIEQALAGRCGWVFLWANGRLVPAAPVGSPGESMRPDLEAVAEALEQQEVRQLDAGSPRSELAPARLVGGGVDLLVRIEHRERWLGALLLGGPASGAGYSDRELAFVQGMARQAALALHNATLAEALITSESQSARATFAAGLLHDLGKQINWIRMIAGRLPGRLDDPAMARRDLENVSQLSRELSRRIREFIAQPRRDEPWTGPAERVAERAVEAIGRIHAGDRVEVSIPPDARRVPVDLAVGQVLVNVLDNALLASDADAPVLLSVQREGQQLRFSVSDRGVGLDHLEGQDPFRLGFSSRSATGGTGTGLAYAKATVEALGGTIVLGANPPRGARVDVHVPVAEGELRLAATSA